jgi:Tol biopolymer transport system component
MSLPAFFRRPAVLTIAALCLLAAVMTVLGRLTGGPRGAPEARALAEDSGAQATPAFSPDGRRLAYSARGLSPGDPFHIFVRPLGGGAPRQLTEGASSDIGPVWSPDGATIAFLRLTGTRGQCMAMPSDGGAPGTVADCSPGAGSDSAQPLPALAWTRDGKSLVAVQASGGQLPALAVIPLRGGTPRALSRPPDGVAGDATPAVSPDGSAVAFVRVTREGGDIWLCDPSGGNLRRVTFDDRDVRGIAWTPDGRELVYSSNRAGGWRLLRVAASGGSPREIRLSGRQAQYPALDPAGKRLAYIDTPSVSAIWRARLEKDPGNADEKPLIRSKGVEVGPAYSPDGTRIADVSDQSGADEIWVSAADGSQRTRITDMRGPQIWPPRWSPDGRTLLFDGRAAGMSEVYSAPSSVSAPVKPKRLAVGSGASWSRNGRSILLQARGQIWRANPDGSNPRPIVNSPGANWPVESSDGRYVYFRDHLAIWRVPADGGTPEEVVTGRGGFPWPFFDAVPSGLFYSGFSQGRGGMAISFFDFATRQSTAVLLVRNTGVRQRGSFSVSPDRQYIVYPRVDRSATQLMVAEDFQ